MARAVTRRLCAAFEARKADHLNNTRTDGTTLFLHGRAIARHTGQGLEVRTCGFNTVTTRDRLNGLSGVWVHQKTGTLYLLGKPWPDHGLWTNVRAWADADPEASHA